MNRSPELNPAVWNVDAGLHGLSVGAGCLGRLGEVAAHLGGSRALLVTDPGLLASGHAERARRLLAEAGLDVESFSGAAANPSTIEVESGAAAARAHRADLLVALGGGSALDCCKGINFLVSNGGRMEDYWGFGKATRPMLPSIGVPTTAGTGSEAQSYAVISQAAGHRKMACGDRQARFREVLLDPELLTTTPLPVAAMAGFDAVAHAVESCVSMRANPLSRLLSRDAFGRIVKSFLPSLTRPAELTPLAEMQWGAYLAGWAIEASMLGAAHACANPLTVHCHLPHGVAIGLMLPHAVRFNTPQVGEHYATLLTATGHRGGGEELAVLLEEMRSAAGLPSRLQECGVQRDVLKTLAAAAGEEWTGRFNPRPVGLDDLLQLYEAAF